MTVNVLPLKRSLMTRERKKAWAKILLATHLPRTTGAGEITEFFEKSKRESPTALPGTERQDGVRPWQV